MPTATAACQFCKLAIDARTYTHAIKGCFRKPGHVDVLAAMGTAIQVLSEDSGWTLDCRPQPVFGSIVDLKTLHWRDAWQQAIQDGLRTDFVLMLSAAGNISILRYSQHLLRFQRLTVLPGFNDAYELATCPGEQVVVARMQFGVKVLHMDRILARSATGPSQGCFQEIKHLGIVNSVCVLPMRPYLSPLPPGHSTVRLAIVHCPEPYDLLALTLVDVYTAPCAPAELRLMKRMVVNERVGGPLQITGIPGFPGVLVLGASGITSYNYIAFTLQPIEQHPTLKGPFVSFTWDDADCLGDTRQQRPSLLVSTLSGDLGRVVCLTPGNTEAMCLDPAGMESELSPLEGIMPALWMLSVPGNGILAMTDNGDLSLFTLATMSIRVGVLASCAAPLADFVVCTNHTMFGLEVNAVCGFGANGRMCTLHATRQLDRVYGTCGYAGVAKMFSVKARPRDSCHSLVLLSFANSSRALSAGATLSDISEAVGLEENGPTVACSEIADLLMVQVTNAYALLCRMDALVGAELPASPSGDRVRARRQPSLSTDFAEMAVSDSEAQAKAMDTTSHAATSPCTPAVAATDIIGADAMRLDPLRTVTQAREDVWRPPDGATISAAAVAPGLALVFCTPANKLVALRVVPLALKPSPSKRKRSSREWSLVEAASMDLQRDPSTIHIVQLKAGDYLCLVATHEPGLELLHFQATDTHGQAGMFTRLHHCSSASLDLLFRGIGLTTSDIDDLLGLEGKAAESAVLLPESTQLEAKVVVGWRSGALLQLKYAQEPGGSLDLSLMAVQRMGGSPLALVSLPPGLGAPLLASGERGMLLREDPASGLLHAQGLQMYREMIVTPLWLPAEDDSSSDKHAGQFMLLSWDAGSLSLDALQPGIGNLMTSTPLGLTPTAIIDSDVQRMYQDEGTNNQLLVLSRSEASGVYALTTAIPDVGEASVQGVTFPSGERPNCMTAFPRFTSYGPSAVDKPASANALPEKQAPDGCRDGIDAALAQLAERAEHGMEILEDRRDEAQAPEEAGNQADPTSPGPSAQQGSPGGSGGNATAQEAAMSEHPSVSVERGKDGNGDAPRHLGGDQDTSGQENLTAETPSGAALLQKPGKRGDWEVEQLIAVGTALSDPSEDPQEDAAWDPDRIPCGRIIIFEMVSHKRTAGLWGLRKVAEANLPGAVHALAVHAEGRLVASVGPHLVVLDLASRTELVALDWISPRRAITCIAPSNYRAGAEWLLTGDAREGLVVYEYESADDRNHPGSNLGALGGEIRSRPVTGCLPIGDSRLIEEGYQDGDRLKYEALDALQGIITTDECGGLVTLSYEDIILRAEQASPETNLSYMAVGNLLSPLVGIRKGKLIWEGKHLGTAFKGQEHWVAASSLGEIFAVATLPVDIYTYLRCLQDALAQNAVTAPLSGDPYPPEPALKFKGKDGRLPNQVLDGEMLAQFLHLPQAMQLEVLRRVSESSVGFATAPAVAAMLINKVLFTLT